jgi:hypothetical protein
VFGKKQCSSPGQENQKKEVSLKIMRGEIVQPFGQKNEGMQLKEGKTDIEVGRSPTWARRFFKLLKN